jgi:hypothetical protein
MSGQSDRVTLRRYSDGKLSGSRNGTDDCSQDPDGCHFCREPFASRQMRYPIKTDVSLSTWGVASVCMPCFKCEASACEIGKQSRVQRTCYGCGAPLLIPPYWGDVCSTRCYQRFRRQRKRELRRCTACKGAFKPARKDALYCSPKCRQSAYRTRNRLE